MLRCAVLAIQFLSFAAFVGGSRIEAPPYRRAAVDLPTVILIMDGVPQQKIISVITGDDEAAVVWLGYPCDPRIDEHSLLRFPIDFAIKYSFMSAWCLCGETYPLGRHMRLKDRIIRSLSTRRDLVVLRADFAKFGSPSQVSRVIAEVVKEGRLIRVGQGIYAKTRVNQFTKQPSVNGTLEEVAAETFRKLKIAIEPSRAMLEYNAGRTTQMPMEYCINTKGRRISRRIEVGTQTVKYEKAGRT